MANLTSNDIKVNVTDLQGNLLATYSGLNNLPNKRDLKNEIGVKDPRKGATDAIHPEMLEQIKNAIAATWEAISKDWIARHGSLSLNRICEAVTFSIMMHGGDDEAAEALLHTMTAKARREILKDELAGYATTD
jgi:hypothetical protein